MRKKKAGGHHKGTAKSKKFIRENAPKKNNKFIQRAKEMEDFQRKQRQIEDVYNAKAQSSMKNNNELQQCLEINADALEMEDNAFGDLVSTLKVKSGLKSIENPFESKKESSMRSNVITKKTIQQTAEHNKESDSDDVESNHSGYEIKGDNCDSFSSHLDYELDVNYIDNLLATATTKTYEWNELKSINFDIPVSGDNENSNQEKMEKIRLPSSIHNVEQLEKMGVKSLLAKNIVVPLTKVQSELFTIINNYHDLFYPGRSFGNASEIRQIYCIHTLNHLLKTRSRIMRNSSKLTLAKKSKKDLIVPDSCRDQGLVRPKVLIILPFRKSAFEVVNTIAQLLYGDANAEKCKSDGTILNYKRFSEEYTGDTIRFPKGKPKPDDYVETFSGNTDDNFRIGISLTKKSLKLYTEFYSSDILIASPLGLRMVIGAAGSSDRDYDFLNSIELLIMDQAELFLAQNWENLLLVLDHLHLQLQTLRDTDLQRVRPWALNGLSKFYRQTLLLTSHDLPDFRSLFSSKCCNYQGKVRVSNPIFSGEISNVIVSIPEIFELIYTPSFESTFDLRFQYFINEVLPRFKKPSFAHCMVYVPSYFDYVRLRNYFKKETVSFVQICEYTKDAKIARARDIFFHSGAHFLLYSERSHFFRRTRIKGIRHLIMYQPPLWPNLYSEMINMMHNVNQNPRDGLDNSMSVTVLYTKYDILQLNHILGSKTATELVKSGKSAHAFTIE